MHFFIICIWEFLILCVVFWQMFDERTLSGLGDIRQMPYCTPIAVRPGCDGGLKLPTVACLLLVPLLVSIIKTFFF
jgi:hypothetical protein